MLLTRLSHYNWTWSNMRFLLCDGKEVEVELRNCRFLRPTGPTLPSFMLISNMKTSLVTKPYSHVKIKQLDVVDFWQWLPPTAWSCHHSVSLSPVDFVQLNWCYVVEEDCWNCWGYVLSKNDDLTSYFKKQRMDYRQNIVSAWAHRKSKK